AGRSIKEIFETEGEQGFRDRETAVLREVLLLEDHVIAAGGGVVLREENRQLLKESGHRVIYLKCEPAVLAERIERDPATAAMRPALVSGATSSSEVETLLAEREPIYRQVMHAELDVTHLSPEDATVYLTRLM